ncbi:MULTISPECIES: TetR/AcrR family transcriptional regulator [unclassified Paenibacillus]|uniref:TetR/AcrR family transcriptional regulator n=1 Tax=unclassified Paenibacillus TaxID=185978 RepID=UPI00083819D6|nr:MULTISPECIES: TetR/AcrR family transcriptional regulator [unclassified Paenibacillus]NWL89644.1 TetR family transcriptional regulator [Paenibacillus sp. 79R4]
MSNQKQKDIMDASLALFSERGYDGTTIPMIAEKAQVGAGTIYRYFENKEQLVNELFQSCLESFLNKIKENFPYSSTDLREQFHHIFQKMIELTKQDVYLVTFIESHCTGHYLTDQSREMFRSFLNFLSQFLDKGREQGIIVDHFPTQGLIAIVYGAYSQLNKLIQYGVLQWTEELLDGIEECCWNAIRIN